MAQSDEAQDRTEEVCARSRGRVPTATLLVVVCLLLLAWALLVLPGARQGSRDRAIMKVLTPARRLALEVETIKRNTGAYPKQKTAYESIMNSGGQSLVSEIEEAVRDLHGLGLSGGFTHFGPSPTAEVAAARAGELYAVVSDEVAVRILPGGLVRVTNNLVPSARVRPDWLRVDGPEASDRDGPGGGED